MSIQTDFPLLQAPENYVLKVEKVELKKSNGGQAMIHIEYSTAQPAKALGSGDMLQPGVRVFDNIMLEPSGKADWKMVNMNVGALLQAARVPGLTSNAALRSTPNLLVGKQIKARVGYEPAGTKNGKAFKEKNVISSYIKP